MNEYNQCNDAVREAIGQPEYNSHIFRFPGGSTGGPYATLKSQASELLKQNEIMYIDWNVLTGDAETNNLTIEFELGRLQETIGEKNNIIILMHDSPLKQITAEALPHIISYLKEQGYKFKTFYDVLK